MIRIPFAWFLGNEGIRIRLDGDRIAYSPRDIDPEIRDFIVRNRTAIAAELRDASSAPALLPRDTAKKPAERTERLRTPTPRRDPLVEALRGGNA